MKKTFEILTVILLVIVLLQNEDSYPAINKFKTLRLSGQIAIDGKLSEAAWKKSYRISNLTQRDPVEGTKASEKTDIFVTYDENALYIGAVLYDSAPNLITANLVRKDDYVASDVFYFYLDPFLDRRTGFYFGMNAAGSYFDGVLLNDIWQDASWDGVWEGKTDITDEGWTVEMKIPFSQLRFQSKDKYEWGINFHRYINRKNEYDYLVYVPKNESGFVSRFFVLEGIENIKPAGNLELIPYVTSKAEYVHHPKDNPFKKNSNYVQNMGADLKLGIGGNLVLNATINPDFGQVEADPAVVNLSDAENFFGEKRSFFVEGSSIFSFGNGGINSGWTLDWSDPSFFYSRRIGRTPQGSLPDNDYSDYPAAANILGAAKLSGKVGDNINIGTIHALTSRESADYQYKGSRSSAEVEPLTYYGVARVQKEFDEGKSGIGLLTTYTNRFIKNDSRLHDELTNNTLVTGLDGWYSLDKNREWVLSGWAGVSSVAGSRDAMIKFQEKSQRYLQRPDARNYRLDSLTSSITGFAGRMQLSKQQGNLYAKASIGVVDPRFDVNDLGFMRRSDLINMFAGTGYEWNKPNSFYRNIDLGGGLWRSYDFDHNITSQGLRSWVWIQLPNYYNINGTFNYFAKALNNRKTRGGPLTLNPVIREGWVGLNTDRRKPFIFEINYFSSSSDQNKIDDIEAEFEWKPSPGLRISVEPGVNFTKSAAQWIDKFDDKYASDTYGKRYVFGKMDQVTYSAEFRVNWIFTPKLSLQFYVRPMISSGEYSEFKELAKPKTFDFNEYGEGASTVRKDGNDYVVDPDGGGPSGEFRFGNPNFNFKSLRGNAVLRWEYLPGSALYLVWTQEKRNTDIDENFNFRNSFDRLVDAMPDNIFMLKFTYWLNM